jgi:hypothetical protein
MARRQLTDLLQPRGNQEGTIKVGEAPTSAEAPAPVSQAIIIDVAPTSTDAASSASKLDPVVARSSRKSGLSKPSRAPVRSKTAELPPYLTFERKETRLRPDQVTNLNVKARELNKKKDPSADRITDNTLIRVAVDLILARANELRGGDETQLRRSLGL